jgi:hypothetical protein
MARHASPTDDPHWRRLYETTRSEAAADAQQCLSRNTTPQLAHDLVAAAVARLEKTMAADPTPPVRACRRGCGWCCHQPVFLTAPEAVVLVAHLRATWSNERIDRLRAVLAARAAERQEQIEDRTLLAAGLPCVFLDEDNACTIHVARPLTCRGITSSSAQACAERYVDPTASPPPIDPHGHTATRAVLHGLSAALTGAGLAGGMGELNVLVLQLLLGDNPPTAG